jgi:uncharacterized protein YyaL (SSP411 family)
LPAATRSSALVLLLCALAACRHDHGRGKGRAAGDARDLAATVRSTDTIRRDGNHLLGSGSIYLLQHSHNPVDWYPWTSEALALARDQGRPVFLSIGYSSCHWCHVMEAEVFEDDEVAEFLNAHFVSIKVDREERPDLDAAYMAALEAMTGSGGWPMSLFLTPALRPFSGATYLPRDRFLAAARKAWEDVTSARADVDGRAAEVERRVAAEEGAGAGSSIDSRELHAFATAALDRVDSQWGGFRGQTKFPLPVDWTFLLHAARKWGDAPIAGAVRGTLDAMASGGIRDPVGGGFHRYSTDARWAVPHFEKMLYDNAELATLYLEGGAALGEKRYVEVAVDTLDFLLRDMQNPAGGFYASFDADSGGREGGYYVWTRQELRAVAGPDDGDVLARLLGVSDRGPFDGASAVSRRASYAEVAARTGRTVEAVTALWARLRPALLRARAARPRPRADTKIVTAWNGLAITALASGFEATGDVRYRDAAFRAADRLWEVHRRPDGGLFRAANAGHPGENGVLEDYAFFAAGLIALFQATNRVELLERASLLVKAADDRFHVPGGGWFGAEAASTPFPRTVSLDDSVEPTGSSVLMHDHLALLALTLGDDHRRAVDDALAASAEGVRRRGMGAAGWLDAALLRAGPLYDVIVSADDGAGTSLENVASALRAPWIVRARVPARGPDAAFGQLVQAAQEKTAGAGRARAFVCSQGECQAPTADPPALRAQLLQGWAF